MPLTLLLDLDDTLLDTKLDVFTPAYLQALSQHLAEYVPPDAMLRALAGGLQRMNESEDPTHSLEEVFSARFYPELGVTKQALAEVIDRFYEEIFPRLEGHTRSRPEAAAFVEWARGCGHRIAIATDPLLPRKATYHRLRWAGLDPAHVELISTFEDFHFSKTYPAYYAEVLGQLGWPEGPVLMVGNDPARDLIPAHRLGLKTFFVEGDGSSSPGFEAGRGTLSDLRAWLDSVELSTLEPSFKSREAVLAILASTPAVLRTLTAPLREEQWRHEPSDQDWAMNELVCHLRDTEVEIHAMQLGLMIEKPGAFIPRPDSGVWASQRHYQNIDGKGALQEFARARVENLHRVKNLEETIWARPARHAIFGPTNFLEVLGFMADHDRLHTQQAWRTLRSV